MPNNNNNKGISRLNSLVTMVNGRTKTKKRSFNYFVLVIGCILVLHVTFLWSQQELVELKSFDVKLSPDTVDKSFVLLPSSTNNNQTDSMNSPPSNPSDNITQVEKHSKQDNIPPVKPIQTPNINAPKDEAGDKSRLVSLLKTSGVDVTDDILAKLPTWDTIVQLYGPSPIIYGLETCSTFQQTISKQEAYIGPAGTFNTGTNLLADVLHKHCMIHKKTKRFGMLWQVPWGKHNPVSWRFRNIATGR